MLSDISVIENGDVAASDIAEYTLDTGHSVDLIKAEVIDHHHNDAMPIRQFADIKKPRHTRQGAGNRS